MVQRATRWATLCASLLILPISLTAQGLTPEQVVSLRSVGATALSPDGRWIAYTLTQPRDSAEERGSAWAELWIVPSDGGEARRIVAAPATASAPKWAPDSIHGPHLGFIAQLEGDTHRQVYVVQASAGEPVRLTDFAASVGDFAWAPDGTTIAFTAPRLDTPPARDPLNDVMVMTEQGTWTRLYVQRVPIQRPHLTVIGGDPRPLTPPDKNVVAFAWAPDGRTLAVQATDELGADADQLFRDLYAVPAAGGPLRELVPTPGKLGAMAYAPDGRTLAYLGATAANDPLAQSVFVAPAAGGEPRNLTPGFAGSVVSLSWLDDATLAFVADESTRTTLNRVPAAGGPITRMAGGGAEIFGAVSFDARGRGFATAASTAAHPAELFVGTVAGGALRRLTNHNEWLAEVRLGRQETVRWTGPEELAIEGVLIYPTDYQEGRRFPLAILPHGGPEGVSLDGWVTNPLYPAQVLAGRGYAVLMPNYRGSGGRGVAFSKADHRDLGGREFEDVIAGIDALVERGLVDPERVGISGTSYGGYFSAWAATRWSHRFKVAIPFAGLTHWASFMYTTDIPAEMSVVHFDLWCSENVGLCWDRSPVAHIEKAHTPTLIGHGLADERVHPEQSIQLYNALKLQGVPVELVLYPREPHGLRERAHQLDYMRRVTEWLDRYLTPGRPAT